MAPFATHYSLTQIDPDSQRYLRVLAKNPNIFLAIISGRRAADVKKRVGIKHITYSGNHGLEIDFPNQTEYVYPLSDELKKNFTLLRDELNQVRCFTKILF